MNPRHLLALIPAAAVLAFAGSASAATTIGSSLAHAPNSTICAAACTGVITALPQSNVASGGATSPIDGVVVRWRFRNAGVTVTLAPRVVSGTTGGAAGDPVTVTGNGIQTFPTRLPIKAGDLIGVDRGAGVGLPAFQGVTGGSFAGWLPPLGKGETRAATGTSSVVEIPLNFDVEPDADRDGFGDETQDQCPTDASTHGPCPAPAPPAEPAAQPTDSPMPSSGGDAPTTTPTVDTASPPPSAPLALPGPAPVTTRVTKCKRVRRHRKAHAGKRCVAKKARVRHRHHHRTG